MTRITFKINKIKKVLVKSTILSLKSRFNIKEWALVRLEARLISIITEK